MAQCGGRNTSHPAALPGPGVSIWTFPHVSSERLLNALVSEFMKRFDL